MQVRLQDRRVRLLGDGGEAGDAIAAGLLANGADLVSAPNEPIDILVTFSQQGSLTFEDLSTSCREAATAMDDGGRILNVVSVTGVVPMRGDDSAPMQAAAIAFSRTLALDLGPRGIRVNALAVATKAASARMVSHIPDGRAPTAEAVADAALFLLDPDNTYMTGHLLVADCGWSVGYGRDF